MSSLPPAGTDRLPRDELPLVRRFALTIFVLAAGMIEVVAWCFVPSFRATLADLGCGPLPAVTVWTLNAAQLARSPPGILVALAVVAASVVGYRLVPRRGLYWGLLGLLTASAMAWLGLLPFILFPPLLERIR